MIRIENKYDLNEIVFLKTDKEQMERIVTAIVVSVNGLRYELSCGTEVTWHFVSEITTEKSLV